MWNSQSYLYINQGTIPFAFSLFLLHSISLSSSPADQELGSRLQLATHCQRTIIYLSPCGKTMDPGIGESGVQTLPLLCELDLSGHGVTIVSTYLGGWRD